MQFRKAALFASKAKINVGFFFEILSIGTAPKTEGACGVNKIFEKNVDFGLEANNATTRTPIIYYFYSINDSRVKCSVG